MRLFGPIGLTIATTLTAGIASTASAAGLDPYISEIRIAQTGPNTDRFIEITGAPGTDLSQDSIVVIGDIEGAFPPEQNGGIEMVVSLDGVTIPGDGVLLIAEDTFSQGTPDATASLPFETADNLTVMLVENFTGAVDDDLDSDNDGILDIEPWTMVLSSVAILIDADPNGFSSDYFYSNDTVGPVDGFTPLHAWQCTDTGAWRPGSDALGGPNETPGELNATCDGGGGGGDLVLNEYRLDQSGSDNDEYVELAGTPGTSLDGVFFIAIGDGTGGSGVAECVIDLSGSSIGNTGYFVICETTFSLGQGDLVLESNGLNLENSDNVTYLLVRDFTGEGGADLDTDDNGVIDSPLPWSEVIDSIALIETFGSGELVYSDNTLGPDGSYVPAQGYRCSPDGIWTIGSFSVDDNTDTPGFENLACPVLQCGGDEARSCFETRAEPGCSDASCCDLVADIDPACASEEWDANCVQLAQQTCLSQGSSPSLTLSEVRMKQAGSDDDEFFELTGAPGTSLDGVSLVVIGSIGADSDGGIETAVNLSGYSIGKSGYFVAAEESFTLGNADATLDLVFNDSMNKTLLLVFNFTGTVNGDLDTNNDCTLDSQPWDTLIDGVAWTSPNDTNCVYYGTATPGDGDYSPGHAYVCELSSGTWGVGTFAADDSAAADTPGTANPEDCDTSDCEEAIAQGLDAVGIDLLQNYGPEGCCSFWDAACDEFVARNLTFESSAPAEVFIDEMRIDQFGDDNDEYIELSTAPGQSLDGYTVIVIGDGSTGSGQVETRIPLIDVTADDNGLVLIADGSTYTLGTPSYDFSFDIENSDNITCLVVYGFSGDDLAPDLDAEDDGVLDTTPWVETSYCVALIETDPATEGDQVYCDTQVGPDTTFVPAHVYFDCGLEMWEIGLIDPVGETDTPGELNPGCDSGGVPCPGDFNGDGVVDGGDFGNLLASWGLCTGCPQDLNGDGSVTGADVGLMLSFWGQCP